MQVKKYYILFIIIYLSIFTIHCEEKENFNIDILINIGELEPLDITFKKIEYSSLFIEKYNLNQDEIYLIGSWGKNDFLKIENKENIGEILTIDFLPNKIAILYGKTKNNDNFLIYYLWKIEDNKVKIKLLRKNDIIRESGELIIKNIVKYPNSKYIVISKVEIYEKAYYQKTPFNWTKIISKNFISNFFIK